MLCHYGAIEDEGLLLKGRLMMKPLMKPSMMEELKKEQLTIAIEHTGMVSLVDVVE